MHCGAYFKKNVFFFFLSIQENMATFDEQYMYLQRKAPYHKNMPT